MDEIEEMISDMLHKIKLLTIYDEIENDELYRACDPGLSLIQEMEEKK